MKHLTLYLLVFMAFVLVSCETPQVARHAAPDLPPEIQKAQNEVWDLQYQMYQAQHDLAIAQINENEANLLNQKNSNPGAYSTQYTELYSNLELRRAQVETRYNLTQQWYSAVQNGDLDAAKSLQQELNQP